MMKFKVHNRNLILPSMFRDLKEFNKSRESGYYHSIL